MPDIITFLYNIYDFLPGLGQFVMTYFFGHIVLRGLIGKDVSTWLDEKGWFPDGLLHGICKFFTDKWNSYWSEPRRNAIRSHYQNDHRAKLQLCAQEHCKSL